MNLCDGTNYFAGCLGGSPGTLFLPCITSVESAPSSQVELFPNPAESYCYIKISEQSARLTLLDFSGRKMLDQVLIQQVTRVNLASLSQGIYWYRIENEKGMIGTGKLIIE